MGSTHRRANLARPSFCATGLALLCIGCSGDLFFGFDSEIERGLEDGPVTAGEVLIRFRNFSPIDAVNVEFFATNETLGTVPDDLFVEDYRTNANIGVAGTGILEPAHSDAIVLPCTEDLVIGTTGGTFSDNDTGEVRGTGDRRWAQAKALGLCGRAVTFEFAPDNAGFITRITIGQ